MPTRPDEPVTTWMWLQFFVWRVLPRLKNLLWTNRAFAVDARVTSVCGTHRVVPGHGTNTSVDWPSLLLSSKRRGATKNSVSLGRFVRHRLKAVLTACRYCFGGTTAIRFAATDLIESVVICHPGPFSLPQIQAIRVPASWVCAEGIDSIQRNFASND